MTKEFTYKLLSGEIVKNNYGTYYFVKPGNWVDSNGYPIIEKLHRKDGPAVELASGHKAWCRNGKYHREDGPAIEYADGSKHWCRNGKFHREDGPAYEDANGSKIWYLNHIPLTEEEFNQQVKSK